MLLPYLAKCSNYWIDLMLMKMQMRYLRNTSMEKDGVLMVWIIKM